MIPPLRPRLAFWLLGRRLPEPYRAWVADRVLDVGYPRRRLFIRAAIIAVGSVLIQSPVLLRGDWWPTVGVLPIVLTMLIQATLIGTRPDSARRARLLAYFGVTADGRLVEPVAVPAALSRPALVPSLVAAQALVAITAGGLLLGHVFPGRPATATCNAAGRADLAAVTQLLTSTTADGIRLEHPRVKALGPVGMFYLGAQVVDGSGRSLGTGVWRVISAHNALGFSPDVAAANPVAQTLTPDLGRVAYAGSAGPPACLTTP